MPNAISLTLRTSIAAPGRGALVRADGEHAPSQRAAPHGDDEQAEERRWRPARPSRTRGSGRFPSRPRYDAVGPRLMPKSCGSGTGEPVAPAAPGAVWKPKLKIGDRGSDGHDGERHAAHAQRRHRRDEPEQHGGGDAGERRQREADARVDGEVRDGEAGDAGERELDDRDLADEAGDHDQREGHHDADQRVRQRLAEVERQHDERDRAEDRRGDRRGRTDASARGTSGRRCSTSSPRVGSDAPRRNIAATMSSEDEQLLDAGPRRAVAGREPRLRRHVARSATRACRCRGRRRTRSRTR